MVESAGWSAGPTVHPARHDGTVTASRVKPSFALVDNSLWVATFRFWGRILHESRAYRNQSVQTIARSIPHFLSLIPPSILPPSTSSGSDPDRAPHHERRASQTYSPNSRCARAGYFENLHLSHLRRAPAPATQCSDPLRLDVLIVHRSVLVEKVDHLLARPVLGMHAVSTTAHRAPHWILQPAVVGRILIEAHFFSRAFGVNASLRCTIRLEGLLPERRRARELLAERVVSRTPS